MKTASKRTILTVILAIVFVFSVTIGALLVSMQNKIAYAVGEGGTTATITADSSIVKRGGTVEVTVTIPMPEDVKDNEAYYWSAVSLGIGPLNADKTGFDESIAQHLSSVKDDYGFEILKFSEGIELDRYDSPVAYDIESTGDHFTVAAQGGAKGFFLWSIALKSSAVPALRYHGTIELTVSFNVPEEMTANEITFGIAKMGTDAASIGTGSTSEAILLKPQAADTGIGSLLGVEPVTVKVVDVATEANLVKVDVGHGASLDEDALTTVNYYDEETTSYQETGTYDCEHFAMFPLVLQPTLADDTTGAVVKFGFDADTVATTGEELDTEQGWISLEKPEGETAPTSVYIYVQAENCEFGEDGTVTSGKTKVYELKLESSYIGLSDLVFKDYSVVTDAVYAGLFSVPETGDAEEVEFDPEVLEYRYYLLSDSLKQEGDESLTLSLTASVPEDAGISTQIAIAEVADTTTLTIPDDAGKSGEEFDIELPTDSASYVLTLTVTKEDDAEVKKVYTIHLDVKNCDVSLKVQVKGPQPSANIYNSSDAKALQNDVDFYFSLNKETITDPTTDAVFDRLVTEAAVKSTVDLYKGENKLGEVNDNTKAKSDMEIQEVLGEYKLLVTAEAGNTKEYTFICAAPGALALTLESQYQFLYEKAGDGGTNRRAYDEDDMTHTLADEDNYGIETVVLGQVRPHTSINEFIANIDPTQLEILWVYNGDNECVYKLGEVETKYSSMADNASLVAVGTNWTVELKGSESGPVIDSVVLSILGDVNGDGEISSLDTATINLQIGTIQEDFSDIAIKLAAAASMDKSCSVGAQDVAALNAVIAGTADIGASYYVKPSSTPDPSEPTE